MLVSNLCRTMPNRSSERLLLLLLLSYLAPTVSTVGQTAARVTQSPAAGQNHATESGEKNGNSQQPAFDTVRVFYTYITRYQPLGIPQGRAKKALWPLLSKRLVQELDTLQVCEDDYYKRYGDSLRANQYKPATPWLEDGLFSGPNEAASPSRFSILSVKTVGENRVEVHLRFTYKQTYCCGYPTSYDHYQGVVTVIFENGRFVVDDFMALDDAIPPQRLSDGYPHCKGGVWVGRPSMRRPVSVKSGFVFPW
jgi:hypothetical protein